MSKEWTEEDIRAMIADSRRIVEEDRQRAEYARLHDKYGKPKPPEPEPEPPADPKKTPPPKQDPEPEPDKKKRKPLWPVGYNDEGEE